MGLGRELRTRATPGGTVTVAGRYRGIRNQQLETGNQKRRVSQLVERGYSQAGYELRHRITKQLGKGTG